MVRMKHPKLPADQTIDVPENGVVHRERAGWRRVPAEKPPEKPVDTKHGKADAKPQNDEGAN